MGARAAVETAGATPEAARILPEAAAEASKGRAEEALAAGAEKVTEAGAKIEQPAAKYEPAGPISTREVPKPSLWGGKPGEKLYIAVDESGKDIADGQGRTILASTPDEAIAIAKEWGPQKPAAKAAEPAGGQDAIPIREAETVPVEVPPGDRGAVEQGVREQAPAQAPVPEAPETRSTGAEVLLTPEATEAKWDKLREDLSDNLDSFSPARETGRRNYELDDVVDRFVEYAKNDKSGKPLSQLAKDFSKTDEASKGQIRKLNAAIKELEAHQEPTPAKAKEPWEMTQDEWNNATRFYRSGKTKNAELPTGERIILKQESTPKNFKTVSADFLKKLRKQSVVKALNEGNPVPPEVLADYPDLKPPVPPAAAEPGPPEPQAPPMSPGPGAAALGTPGTGSAIRELGDYIASLPRLPGKQKLSLAERWAEAQTTGRDIKERLALKGAAITESIKDTARGVRRPTELGNTVGDLDFLLQKSAAESLTARKQLEHAVPDRATREALWIYADAKGDLQAIRDTLLTMPRDTKPAVRRALQRALNLPQKAKDWLPYIEQFYGRKFAEGEAEGVLHQALPDYFTHVWKLKEDMPGSVQAALNSGKINEFFRYARERKLSTMLEGIKNPRMVPGMKMEPILDAAKIVAHYNYALDRAIASRNFMARLSDMNASDGRPMVAPSGRAIPSEELKWAVINDATGRADPFVKGIFDTQAEANADLATRGPGYHVEQRKNEFLMIKSRIKPEELAGYRAIDHPSMRKWQWATTDNSGKTILYEGELLAHPEAYERLARFMDRSRLTPSKLTAGALRYSGEVKAAKLGLLSTFHQVHVAKHAIFHWTNPFRAKPIDWDSPMVKYAIEKGHLKLAPEPGELNQFAEGIMANEALIHKLPIIGEWSRRYSEFLFTDYIPRLKMATFENALARNRKIYGTGRTVGGAIKAFGAKPLSEAEIAARVGDSVNAAFGELNKLWLGKMGRDPKFQRQLRLIFLAPDFLEARARFVGKAFTKYGAEERFALAMNFVTIYGLARVANWLATGDAHADDPKHWFDVKVGDHWWSMRSVMTDIAHLFAKPESFARVRTNPAFVEPLIEFFSSRDWRGNRVKGIQKAVDYADKFTPITLQGINQDDRHIWEGFLGSMGIQPRKADPVSQIYERVADFKKAKGIKEAIEVSEAPVGNPYRKARIAIEFDDEIKFWRAVKEQHDRLAVRGNKNPSKTIKQSFERYYAQPFTGNKRLEPEFKAGLDDADKKLYADAERQRKASWQKLQQWWNAHAKGVLSQP